MLRYTTTLLLTFCLIFLAVTGPTFAQPPIKSGPNDAPEPSTATNTRRPDLKKVFDEETRKFNADSARFDAAKAERESRRQQQSKKGWSTQKKLLVAAVVVGIAALVFVLVKYGKDCIRSSPENCTVGVDEICTCLEYEKRN